MSFIFVMLRRDHLLQSLCQNCHLAVFRREGGVSIRGRYQKGDKRGGRQHLFRVRPRVIGARDTAGYLTANTVVPGIQRGKHAATWREPAYGQGKLRKHQKRRKEEGVAH